MIVVIGTFRLPLQQQDKARTMMQDVIARTLQEEGCKAYSYAQDAGEPDLFHVTEVWTDRAALDRHFTTPHMRAWTEARAALGFHERRISVHALGEGEEL